MIKNIMIGTLLAITIFMTFVIGKIRSSYDVQLYVLKQEVIGMTLSGQELEGIYQQQLQELKDENDELGEAVELLLEDLEEGIPEIGDML